MSRRTVGSAADQILKFVIPQYS